MSKRFLTLFLLSLSVLWLCAAVAESAPMADYMSGMAYEAGQGVEKDLAKAAELYEKAANAGLPQAQNRLGEMYRDGVGVRRDENLAVEWFTKAANSGFTPAQANLAALRGESAAAAPPSQTQASAPAAGSDIEQLFAEGKAAYDAENYAMALYPLTKAAEAGHPEAQFYLGVMYENGRGVTNDDAQAAAWYRRAADQGFARAQYNLGWMYANGRGVTKDDAQAVAWYRKAAEQGLAIAQFSLGSMYEDGRGVTKDESMAIEYYKMAARQGEERVQEYLARRGIHDWDAPAATTAQTPPAAASSAPTNLPTGDLRTLLTEGRAAYGAKDYAKAFPYFYAAAEEGHADALYHVGLMYYHGQSVAENNGEAAAYFRKAAAQNYAPAQTSLAAMYEYGHGVGRDRDEAIRLYRLAAGQGNDNARTALTRLGVTPPATAQAPPAAAQPPATGSTGAGTPQGGSSTVAAPQRSPVLQALAEEGFTDTETPITKYVKIPLEYIETAMARFFHDVSIWDDYVYSNVTIADLMIRLMEAAEDGDLECLNLADRFLGQLINMDQRLDEFNKETRELYDIDFDRARILGLSGGLGESKPNISGVFDDFSKSLIRHWINVLDDLK